MFKFKIIEWVRHNCLDSKFFSYLHSEGTHNYLRQKNTHILNTSVTHIAYVFTMCGLLKLCQEGDKKIRKHFFKKKSKTSYSFKKKTCHIQILTSLF